MEKLTIDEAREYVQGCIEEWTPLFKPSEGKMFKGKMMTYAGLMRKYLNELAKSCKKDEPNVAIAAKEAVKQFN